MIRCINSHLMAVLDEFQVCTQLQFSGKLDIKSSKGHKWSFYYRLGRIIWATGGTHPFRRWRRQMTQYCPQIDIDKIRLCPTDLAVEHWDYQLLTTLHNKEKITANQVDAVAENIIAELLFDLAQQTNFASVSCNRNQEVILDLAINFTSANLFLKRMDDEWQTWSSAGLASFNPDLAPVIKQPEPLQQLLAPSVYKNFVNLINGKYTLRDLAINLKQDIVKTSSSLLPYTLKELIQLVEVPDLASPSRTFQNQAQNQVQNQVENNIISPQSQGAKSPLIACIDDSLQICQSLENIIIPNGMRFMKIQDAIHALPILIESKPDLILLDLVMPVVNGYEICTQIRRISQFANIPIIILTGSDGLFDRVRAKVAGSTDFMTKPVVADKVMGVIRKYLSNQLPDQRLKHFSNNSLSQAHCAI
jgi:two-component system, chemotaxis family, response regulator PixG